MSKVYYGKVDEFNYDNLILYPSIDLSESNITLEANSGVYNRGYILGLDASNYGRICNKINVDGSQEAKYILVEDIDTTGLLQDVNVRVYSSGSFNESKLFIGDQDLITENLDQIYKQSLRKYNIFTKKIMNP